MGDVAIRIEDLSKQYYIGRAQASYATIREALIDAVKAPLRRAGKLLRGQASGAADLDDTIWALKNISCEIKQGEVVGVIGRNGAGKSTLLKILARITKPTSGRARLYGRVGTLLEVGTGFHPELTGRENIYLNGTILGMRRAEIERKFDEIVAFAEVAKFLDTPVKHYSSGMYVRLAFAVAAHLEPEILFVDEVLAVGDVAFQEKCLNKMSGIAQTGRTILFVSHNMGAINNLCHRAILLDQGQAIMDGPTHKVVPAYLNAGSGVVGQQIWPEAKGPGNQSFRLVSVALKSMTQTLVNEINISENITIDIEYEVVRSEARAVFSLVLFDNSGYCVFGSISNTAENSYHNQALKPGRYRSSCTIYGNLLNEGRYHISIIGIGDFWSDSFTAHHALSFNAMDDGILKRDYPGSYGGVIRPKLTWQTVTL